MKGKSYLVVLLMSAIFIGGYYFFFHSQNTLSPITIAELVSALESKDKTELGKLEPSVLERLPGYEKEVLPLVRKKALELVLIKFRSKDWEHWTSQTAAASPAREFIDSLTAVNSSLGIYLETAAYLFYDLHQNTAQGIPYPLPDRMKFLEQHTGEIFQARKTVVPPQFMFAPEIVSDETFLRIFEKVRGSLVARYIEKNPERYTSHLALAYSLNSLTSGEVVLASLAGMLRHFSLKTDREFREMVLYNELQSKQLTRFAAIDPGVRRALAELFVMGAVDSLKGGDSIQASKFLRESTALEPGLKIQNVVKARLEAKSHSVKSDVPKSDTTTDETEENKIEKESNAESHTPKNDLVKNGEVLSNVSEVNGELLEADTTKEEFSLYVMAIIFIICAMLPAAVFYQLTARSLPKSSAPREERYVAKMIRNDIEEQQELQLQNRNR